MKKKKVLMYLLAVIFSWGLPDAVMILLRWRFLLLPEKVRLQ